jgi:hypothetical protein
MYFDDPFLTDEEQKSINRKLAGRSMQVNKLAKLIAQQLQIEIEDLRSFSLECSAGQIISIEAKVYGPQHDINCLLRETCDADALQPGGMGISKKIPASIPELYAIEGGAIVASSLFPPQMLLLNFQKHI